MTPNALLTRPESGWQGSLRRAARSMDQILEYTGIPRTSVSGLDRSDFPAFATLEYLDRVERGNAADPLLLQVLPLEQERAPPNGLSTPSVIETRRLFQDCFTNMRDACSWF